MNRNASKKKKNKKNAGYKLTNKCGVTIMFAYECEKNLISHNHRLMFKHSDQYIKEID